MTHFNHFAIPMFENKIFNTTLRFEATTGNLFEIAKVN